VDDDASDAGMTYGGTARRRPKEEDCGTRPTRDRPDPCRADRRADPDRGVLTEEEWSEYFVLFKGGPMKVATPIKFLNLQVCFKL